VTFCTFPFSRYRVAAKPDDGLDDQWTKKRAESAEDVPFGGLDQKWVPLPPSAQILGILQHESRFSYQTRAYLAAHATKFRSRIGI